MHITRKRIIQVWERRKRALHKIATSKEDALVVGWFDVFQMLVFTVFCFVCLGAFPDAFYTIIHTAPAGWYSEADISTCDKLYSFWKYILYVALGAVLVYAINYANVKRGEG